MAFNITTITLNRPPPWATVDGDELPPDAHAASILSALLLPSMFYPVPRPPLLPTPLSTTEFPDRIARKRPKGKRRRSPAASCEARFCAICLEPLVDARIAELPCGHAFHRCCVFGLLTAPALGSASMLTCPLCRGTIDRYTVRSFGCDVSPQRLALAQRRCFALRLLCTGDPVDTAPMQTVCRLVKECAKTEAVDGFLYNACVIALERALFHRAIAAPRGRPRRRGPGTGPHPRDADSGAA